MTNTDITETPVMSPGNTIFRLDGSSGEVTAAWAGTVVYASPTGELALRGQEIDNFVETGQGHWTELTLRQLHELETEKSRHLDEYKSLLNNDFREAESYLHAPSIAPQIRRVLVGEKSQFIRTWVSTFSPYLPDREQSEAIGSVSGNTLVTARAGSGKTATLVNRALFLIRKCGVLPEKILLLAFNKKAALEIRRKMLAVLDPAADERVTALFSSRLSKNESRVRKLKPIDLETQALDKVVKEIDIGLPHTMTFHALAHRIIHPEEDILYDEKEGNQSQSRAVQEIIDDWLSEPEAHERIRTVMLEHFRQDWEYLVRRGFDRDKGSFLEYRRSIVNETLNGEYVKSFGEKLIADFLFEHDVAYKYERNFRWNQFNYKPDFTVFPKQGRVSGAQTLKLVVIEYFGLSGDPDYDDMSQEKRVFWSNREDAAFIEYAPDDISSLGADRFRDKVKEDLESLGIRCRPLTEDEIWQKARNRLVDGFTKAVRSFVSRCRKLALTVDELDRMIARHAQKYETEQEFYEIASQIYAAYLDRLEATGEEDFDGLILRAVEAIQGGQTTFYSKSSGGDLAFLEHMCVDEYQDFSELFHRLLQAIREKSRNLSMFCVGDDWQAINGFAGSDLRFFRDFESFFPNSMRLSIATNYRSSSSIVDIGNTLMFRLGNPSRAHVDDIGTVEIADLAAFSPTKSEKSRFQGDEITPATLRLVYQSIRDGNDVAILARRNGLPYYFILRGSPGSRGLPAFERSIRSNFSSDDHHKIEISTAHSYKGLEKHKVIVIDAVDRSYPLIHPNWIFSRLFGDDLAEVVSAERRLFYVALTRAVRELVIVTDSRRPSEFLARLTNRTEIDKLDWRKYDAPPAPDSEICISLSSESKSGGTYPIKDRIKASGYRWFSGTERCWRKFIPSVSFDLNETKREPWVNEAIGVIVIIENENDEIIASYQVEHGRWKVLQESLGKNSD